MYLKNIVDAVKEVKPSEYSDDRLTAWLNEVEAMIQYEVFMFPPDDITQYVWQSEYTGIINFKDDHTIDMPITFKAKKYGKLVISDLTTLAQNNGEFTIANVFPHEKEMSFADHTFTTGEDTGKMTFDGSGIELLLPDGWENLYQSYLIARIEQSNLEYDMADDTFTLFNKIWSSFNKWYTTHYPNWRSYYGR